MAAVQHQPRAHYPRPSPFASSRYGTLNTTASTTRYVNVSDSDSDDEPPPAIKFSKVTEALLNDKPIPSSPIRLETAAHRALRGASASHAILETPSRAPGIRVIRKSSPSALDSTDKRRGSTPPRIVHIGSAQLGSARRTVSIAGPYPQHGTTPQALSKLDIVTPAQPSGQRPRAGSNASQDGHEKGSALRSASRHEPMDSVMSKPLDSRYPSGTFGRARNLNSENGLNALSQRIKRAQIPTNSLLRGPVRRWRPRESDDNISPIEDHNSVAPSAPSSSYTPQGSARSRSRSNSVNTRATSIEPDSAPEKHDHSSRPGSRQAQTSFSRSQGEARPPSRQTSEEKIHARLASVEPLQSSEQRLAHRNPSVNHSYRYVSEEQENAPPPTFKRNKEQEFKYLGRVSAAVPSDDEKPRRPAAPLAERKALGTISSNTPLRPAPPPPPKMSVLETATASAGAAATKSRKKRTHVVINGKIFTQMGKIGKGGSSDVYCVMAENYKTFAMKKVKLDDCDESAVRGYKGEIDLLRKLTEVDRVIRLYDWELNEEKQELIVLMEKGDTDLNRVLAMKINGEGSRFDAAFSRYHWKEMLECVQSVHEHDIVHSDLKPANFLVVQGRLKLIDFGIANAIDTDNTCNVHRDSHVGTPNYMSPESITDTNASGPGFQSNKDAEGRPLKKDMKIGKSSDVWSLGCILYQMTYGRPPFAHISNQISRIMAITNPKHIIDFPDTGIGGARIPSSLKGVLKRCLQRDADLRPTIPQLLSDSDDFLNPESNGAVMIKQEVLEQIINKVVDRCRDPKRGLPPASEVAQYAPSFMAKIREMTEKV